MNRPRIIGLVGRARVGKDTVASFFTETHAIRRLAQPVKDACKVLYGWTDEALETDLKEMMNPHWGTTPRTTMVHLTQSLRSFMGPDFFTQRFWATWDGGPIVIPDVRYDHDIKAIHERGGITIKINRPGGPQHEFENEIHRLQTTYEVENIGTIEDLRQKINELL